MKTKTRNRRVVIIVLVVFVLLGLRAVRNRTPNIDLPGGGNGGEAQIQKNFDCTPSSCPELAISGESSATLPNGSLSNVRGVADPSLRKDPSSGRLWLGYSWVHPRLSGSRVIGAEVDNHLARSDDGGKSWIFVKTLWNAGTDAIGPDGQKGHMNSETVSLAPRSTSTGTTWYSSRFVYFTPDGGRPQAKSFTIHITAANSPEQLDTVEEAVLGGDLTSDFWKPNVNLAALTEDKRGDELNGCTFFDAGLLYHKDRLYLGVQCAMYTATGQKRDKEFVALFSTQPNGSPRNWSWNYVGKLANHDDAVVLDGQNLTQTDLAVAKDGALLAIMSPSSSEGKGVLDQHAGCYVVEIESLSPLKLSRDENGNLKVRARVTASDLTAPKGTPASCGYDAASATGIIMARRHDQGGLNSTLNRTGLHP